MIGPAVRAGRDTLKNLRSRGNLATVRRLPTVVIRSDPSLPDAAPVREPFDGRLAAEVKPLIAHARRRFGEERAPEVVQETLLQALRAEATYDPARPLGPWLRTIARHIAGRLGQRESAAPEVLAAPEAVESPSADGDHGELVERLLAELAPGERALLRRHHLEGEPIASIAASLATPEGTIKARLWRARKRLALLAGLLTAGGAALLLPRWNAGPGSPPPAQLHFAAATIVQRPAPAPRLETRTLREDAPGTWIVSGAVLHLSSQPTKNR